MPATHIALIPSCVGQQVVPVAHAHGQVEQPKGAGAYLRRFPCTQTWLLEQTWLHVPHANGQRRRSTHQGERKPDILSSVHTVLGATQRDDTTHIPPMQTCPDMQRLPMTPQLLGLTWRSVHVAVVAVVAVRPDRHTHWPPEHLVALGHMLPTLPQLSGSVATSIQIPGPMTAPAWHRHAPSTHAIVGAQRVPHPPHFNGSVARFAQLPLHAVSPAGHTHRPIAQAWPPTHA